MGGGKNIIDNYVDSICTEVKKDEDSGYVDLMMDNHKCIEWGESTTYLRTIPLRTKMKSLFMNT